METHYDDHIVFEGLVSTGDIFYFRGTGNMDVLGITIMVLADDEPAFTGDYRNPGLIDTSCGQPIGPNAIFGDFTVISGESKNGGELCPVSPPPFFGADLPTTISIVVIILFFAGFIVLVMLRRWSNKK